MNNLKRIIGICSILSVGFIGINVSFAATGTVNTPAARIREKASTDSEVITKAYEDEKIEILAEEGDWYKVKVNGKTGYVSKTLIKTSGETSDKSNTTTNANTNTNNDETTATQNNVSTYTTTDSNVETEKKNVTNKDTVLKLLPNFGSNEIAVLPKGTEVEVKKELNNWMKVSLPDNKTGWVVKNNITYGETAEVEENTNTVNTEEQDNTTVQNVTETNTSVVDTNDNTAVSEATDEVKNTKGKVNVETANVREKADKSADIVGHLDEGDEVTILQEEGDWYKITNSKISNGYVSKSLITTSSEEVSSRSLTDTREEVTAIAVPNSTNGASVVEFAKQFLGTPYVLGGKTPESGFDCSGFTRYVFKNFGYSLGTVASDQDSVGQVVDRGSLQPGDLILFLNEGKTKVGHTGIYIGNDQFIHAANPERGVVIDALSSNSYYNERFVTARRIVE